MNYTSSYLTVQTDIDRISNTVQPPGLRHSILAVIEIVNQDIH